MIGDIILFLKTWWKQNVTCHHKYIYKEYGNIHFEECRKCGRIKNYIGQSMKKIYKKDINKVMPILQALAEGKPIQFAVNGDSWIDIDDNEEGLFLDTLIATPQRYRIKPEPKYYPFENAKECWNEMQKHQPIGWVKDRDGNKTFIGSINSDNSVCMCNSEILFLKDIFEDFTFIDGIPFGVKVEE